MAKLMKKKRTTTNQKVAVKLACSCWADCKGCACSETGASSTPSGQFNADLCATAYYLGKAYDSHVDLWYINIYKNHTIVMIKDIYI